MIKLNEIMIMGETRRRAEWGLQDGRRAIVELEIHARTQAARTGKEGLLGRGGGDERAVIDCKYINNAQARFIAAAAAGFRASETAFGVGM